MNIGVLAGVFDPIHLGHAQFIRRSIDANQLAKVYVLVEKSPKYKKCLASYVHRKRMVELAIADIAQAEIYDSPSPFFPISATLPELRKSHPKDKLYLLVGDDVAEHIYDWPGAETLLKDVELIIAKRDGDDKLAHASSLKIRETLSNGADSVDLDDQVLDYCRTNQLYLDL